MGEGLSHWSSMVLRKSQTYFFDRHTYPNSMYSNFCHVLNTKIAKHIVITTYYHQKVIHQHTPAIGLLRGCSNQALTRD